MRPKLLTICGWGPYKKKETVDFTLFQEHVLFLITGPTGAGKTTIFDALTYALYGNVSGSFREKSGLRSDFADGNTETYVNLKFFHRGKNYEIFRSPKYQRPKKRGTGFIWTLEAARLTMPDGTIVEGLLDVNRKVEEILQMEYAQFKHISMLAQGEFTDLLLSGSKNRTQILRSVFQTEQYELMGQILTERASDLKRKLNAVKDAMDNAMRTVVCEQEKWQELLLEPRYEEIIRFLEEQGKSANEADKGLSARIESCGEEEQKLSADIVRGTHINELFDQLEKVKLNIQMLDAVKEEIEQKKKQRKEAERARKVLPAFQVFYHGRGQLEQEEKRLHEQEKSCESVIQEFAQVEKEYQEKSVLEQQITGIVLEKERAKEQLAKIKEQFLSYQEKSREKENNLNDYKLQLREVLELYGKVEQSSPIENGGDVKLKEGEPCPFCGALHHPAYAGASLEALMEEAEQKKEMLLKERAKLKAEFEKESKEWEKAYEKQEQKEKELKKKTDKLTEAFQVVQNKKTGAMAALKQLKDTIKRQSEILDESRIKLVEQLKEQGFSSVSEWKQFCMEEKALEALCQEIDQYEEQAEFCKKEQGRLKEETEGKKRVDLFMLQEKLQMCSQKRKELQEKRASILSDSARNQAAYDSIKEKWEERKELEERYGMVHHLENMTKGKNAQHLVFEQYVLASYFEEILQAANRRLYRMSDGRYELSRVEEVTDARTKDGLEIQVMDYYTGKYRSIKSLSGGEAFKAALSMALGTSDVVQQYAGGIEIDTLFIDEGFGALDNQSLQQAMETLQSLAEGNKMIGIISHVEQLKERIEQQIVIHKTNAGSKIEQKI